MSQVEFNRRVAGILAQMDREVVREVPDAPKVRVKIVWVRRHWRKVRVRVR